MNQNLEMLKNKGCKIELYKKIILEEVAARLEAARKGFFSEFEKYPKVKEDLKNTISIFEENMKADNFFENNPTAAFDVISTSLNPFMNVFQHMMTKQGEFVAINNLYKSLNAAKTFEEIDAACTPSDKEGNYWEKNIIAAEKKTYSKILNSTVNKTFQVMKKK